MTSQESETSREELLVAPIQYNRLDTKDMAASRREQLERRIAEYIYTYH